MVLKIQPYQCVENSSHLCTNTSANRLNSILYQHFIHPQPKKKKKWDYLIPKPAIERKRYHSCVLLSLKLTQVKVKPYIAHQILSPTYTAH